MGVALFTPIFDLKLISHLNIFDMFLIQASTGNSDNYVLNPKQCKFGNFYYLHEELESIAKTDLLFSVTDLDTADIGIYSCLVFVDDVEYKATLFKFNMDASNGTKGLIVMDTDKIGLKHCMGVYAKHL